MTGERLDLTSDATRAEAASSRAAESNAGRRFVGMQFDCCSVYRRIYINREETAYVGNCPRCGKLVRIKVGPGGTDHRFFTAY